MGKVFLTMAAILAVELVAYWIFVMATGFTLPNEDLGYVIGAMLAYLAYVSAVVIGSKRDW